ncbi:TetR/AcrR family transcriptional regulator [Caulobacter sp. AP07]|uniref:TetR/AcrR family transcriptional regulator n=1 Tax=Caulobacter sp. AP07 TaxID=1144304 RepID=UPI0005578B8D|nr:TetR/AcrR family transcriptional regulator [Caulobacter sp. AP07]
MDTPAQSPRLRRPQAERSADTRAKLIQAAITCLYRTGYSATTVSSVADEAGVSRGAMTHQFPAKTDLMLAVVQSVFESDSAAYNATILEMEPARWLVALPQTMWSVISRPSGIAVMEIMLASRSEPDLAEKLRAQQKRIDERAHEWSAERVRAAGLEPAPEAEAIHELYVAAVRGLALEAVFMNNADGVQRSLRVLSDMMRRFYPDIEDKL